MGGYFENQDTITLVAGAAILQYSVVSVDSAGKAVVTPLAGTSASIIGVAQNAAAAAGDPVTVAISGVTKAIAGATVTTGANVACSTADGRIADLGAARATKYVVGLALSGTTTAGQIVSLLIQPMRTLDIGT